MNETMVDVLIYLYENYMDADAGPPSDQRELREELTMAGFPSVEVDKAIRWLDELAVQQQCDAPRGRSRHSHRIFSQDEMHRLDTGCRGLLLYLEQNGILDPTSRELVIDRALALDASILSEEEIKWIVLLVLMNQPGREMAFAQMEDIIYSEDPVFLH
jgi:Smg protein